MAEELKVYEGAERNQVFVRRYAPNPGLRCQTPRGGYDQRRHITAPLWTYCVKRHRDYWRAQKPKHPHVVPDYRHEGEEGWWFPEIWVVEYEQMKSSRVIAIATAPLGWKPAK